MIIILLKIVFINIELIVKILIWERFIEIIVGVIIVRGSCLRRILNRSLVRISFCNANRARILVFYAFSRLIIGNACK